MMRTAVLAAVTLAALAVSGAAYAGAPAPSPLSDGEIRYLETKERALAPASMETAPVPLGAAEQQSLAQMESASGIDADAITAGTSILDLILLVLLVYLVMRILD